LGKPKSSHFSPPSQLTTSYYAQVTAAFLTTSALYSLKYVFNRKPIKMLVKVNQIMSLLCSKSFMALQTD
jgi:hypothetical protein